MRSNVQKSCDCKEGRIKKREVSVLDEEKPLPTRNDTGQRSVHNSFITVTSAYATLLTVVGVYTNTSKTNCFLKKKLT